MIKEKESMNSRRYVEGFKSRKEKMNIEISKKKFKEWYWGLER